jgi:hypothetical protein
MPALAEMVPPYTDTVTVVADDNDAGRKGAAGLRDGLRARNINVDLILIDHSKN